MTVCTVCELHAESTFKIEGMDCREEVALLERRFKNLPGLEDFTADVMGQRLHVKYDAAVLTTAESPMPWPIRACARGSNTRSQSPARRGPKSGDGCFSAGRPPRWPSRWRSKRSGSIGSSTTCMASRSPPGSSSSRRESGERIRARSLDINRADGDCRRRRDCPSSVLGGGGGCRALRIRADARSAHARARARRNQRAARPHAGRGARPRCRRRASRSRGRREHRRGDRDSPWREDSARRHSGGG